MDLDLVTIRIEASFSGLASVVAGASIHSATAVPGVGIADIAMQVPGLPGFPLGTSGVYDQTFSLGLDSTYNPAFIAASGGTVSDALNALHGGIEEGRAYINIRTDAFPDGEIRGFLVSVPEPAAGILFLIGGFALLLARRSGGRSHVAL